MMGLQKTVMSRGKVRYEYNGIIMEWAGSGKGERLCSGMDTNWLRHMTSVV